jgi:uncharacterized protein (DUF4415 family)
MRKGSSRVPTEAQLAELKALEALPEDQIDTTDAPEVGDWSKARRGALYRPVKHQITLRLDADLIEWFRSHVRDGERYQTAMNAALREYVERRERESASS